MVRKHWFIALGVVLALGSTACSSGDDNGGSSGSSGGATGSSATGGTTGGEGTPVAATVKDFAVAASPASVPAGAVTFTVTNDGPSTHEFVVFKTDLAPDGLPLTAEGDTVDEEGEGLEAVDEIEDIEAGTSPTLTVDLDAGSYVLICNITGHYDAGMHTALTVT